MCCLECSALQLTDCVAKEGDECCVLNSLQLIVNCVNCDVVLCQRRRDEEDELLMRDYLSEGDLISVCF